MPNIAVDNRTLEEAKKLTKTHNLTLGELVQHSVIYFKKTGINPSDADNENPLKAIKELERRVGQIVNYITKQDKEKLNPLLEGMLGLKRGLDDSLKKLPAAERFEKVIDGINKYIATESENHKKQMALLTQSHQKIADESRDERLALIKSINSLQAEQQEIKQVIKDKLSKKGILG